MVRRWEPEMRVHEIEGGCRLTLVGLTYGDGGTLQEAADDLVARVHNTIVHMHRAGFRVPPGAGAPDRRIVAFLWELSELSDRGGDIRARLFGAVEPADDAAE